MNTAQNRLEAQGAECATTFQEDGAFMTKTLLDADAMALCRRAYDWSIANPGPLALGSFPGTEGGSYNDNSNPKARKMYEELSRQLSVANFLRSLWGSEHVYFYGEEIFAKTGGEIGDTDWHQDTTYVPTDGEQWANLWITFEAVPGSNSLGVVKGSHHGPRYGSTPIDEVMPNLWPDADPTPNVAADLEEDPESWDVLRWETTPGEVVVLHPSSLHGGAPVDASFPDRHTLVLRFFGDDAIYRKPPVESRLWAHLAHLEDGDSLSKLYRPLSA